MFADFRVAALSRRPVPFMWLVVVVTRACSVFSEGCKENSVLKLTLQCT